MAEPNEDDVRWMHQELLNRGYPPSRVRRESVVVYLEKFPDRDEAVRAWCDVYMGKTYRSES